MPRITQILLILTISISSLWAQDSNNSWINYSQTYVKFKVAEDGIYRINRNTLTAINNAFVTVNPKNIQVFARGVEQPIYVYGENDFSFDSGDYIELYCEKNDGFLDSLMYENPSEQNNPYYSQINDTISYFITWENSPNAKKRFANYTSSNYSTYSPLTKVKEETIVSYTSTFYWGQRVSHYSSGKGWFDSDNFVYEDPTTKTFDISHRLPSSDVNVGFSVCGAPNSSIYSNLQHNLKIHHNSIEQYNANYAGYQGVRSGFRIMSTSINSNDLSLVFSSNYNVNGQIDRNVIAYVSLEYDRDLDYSGANYAKFIAEPLITNRSISLSNFGGSNSVLYNLSTEERTALVSNAGNSHAVLHSNSLESRLVVVSEEKVNIVSKINAVNFFNYNALTEHPDYLMVYAKKLLPSTNSYASYRSAQGYKVLKAEISDLYDQFAFGIEKHPIAIRNFVEFINGRYSIPKFLFLIGKSVTPAGVRKDSSSFANCLVPTMGNPPSDVLLTSGMNGQGLEPLLATGRIAARVDKVVELYLDKVKEYESSTDGIWKKNAIHFGGGINEYEQITFKNYLNDYKLLFEDTLIGGQVSTFLKNSSDPIQISVSDSVSILINSGVSQMTFFGHGSTSGFDQNIDIPDNYDNFGKYPLILANSCLSGDIHQNTSYRTISEQWVLIPNRGSIGFLAAADLGYASQLYHLSREFYKSLSYKKYGLSIGEIVKDAMQSYSVNQATNFYIRKTVYDNTYHGDPAVVINSFEKPDLQIESSGLSFNPDPVTTEIDSFELNINYYNLGRAFVDSFLISVEREYANGQTDFESYAQSSCMYGGELHIKLPVDHIRGVGINNIKVRLDYLNQIDELNENNNEVELQFIVHSNDLIPIYPYEFAVIPNSTTTLVSSSGDVFSDEFTAVFQIDTIDTFDSPFLLSENINTNGGITEWNLPITLSDSTVYFWRVSRQGTDRWRESSFRHINSQSGWSQGHHFQFKKDEYQFIDYKKEQRTFEYITTPKNLLCKNIGYVSIDRIGEVGYWIDGVGDQNSCGAVNSFNVVVIDSLTLEPWQSDREDFGHRDYPKCPVRTRVDYFFQFSSDSLTSMEYLADFINSIPDGNHILIYSVWNGNYSNLPQNTIDAFEQLHPASQISTLADNIPYILYTIKGDASSSIEKVGGTITSEISLSVTMPTNFDYGNIYSSTIGPALEWKSFHWRYKDNIDDKNTVLKILATDNQGNNSVLVDGLTKDSLDVLDLSDRIDASMYPYLRLQMYCKDSLQKIPTQIKSWSLLYTEVPETAIDIDDGYYFYKDTIEQGEDLVFAISTRNISPYDMDSLKVSYFVKDAQNQITMIKSEKLRVHPSQDVITDTVYFNTISSYAGNSIWVEFNGLDSLTGEYDQLEKHHFNNIAIKYFYVETDKINPLLNVTFDGMHIMDGDIVSPNPEIVIRIKDENQYLAMEDPSLVSIYLKSPDAEEETKIEINDSLSNQQLYWTASSLPDNIAEMLFTPKNLKDGVYTLRVGATDASSNESGQFDYKISFEVINKSTITEILNYPNPFSTSTQFVFTLTGAEIPDEMVIQIMTITGKVVQEIDLTESSNLNIGRNITEYKWDGRDQYGDLLANGVYFYRVFVKMNGAEVEQSSTEASKFFKQGIGKMYIIR